MRGVSASWPDWRRGALAALALMKRRRRHSPHRTSRNMTAWLFWGCSFTAYGPVAAVAYGACKRRPHIVIWIIVCALVWSLFALLSSLLWILLPESPWSGLVLLVTSVQCARWALHRLVLWGTLRGAAQSDIRALFSKEASLAMDVAAGAAFGLASTMASVSPVLDLSFSRATLYTPSCTHASLFWVQSFQGLLFSLLHVCWGVIAFDGLRRNRWLPVIGVGALHLIAAFVTTANDLQSGCAITLPVLSLWLLFNAYLVYRNVMGRFYLA
jgi:hypothetical protein